MSIYPISFTFINKDNFLKKDDFLIKEAINKGFPILNQINYYTKWT